MAIENGSRVRDNSNPTRDGTVQHMLPTFDADTNVGALYCDVIFDEETDVEQWKQSDLTELP